MLLNLTGDPIPGTLAADWGVVDRAVPAADLEETVRGVARTIAARSPVAVGVLKELAAETADLPLAEGLAREAEGFRRCLASEDGLEGVTAFIEKREPVFKGR
jgi:enoyl-CoA hydratase